MTDSIKAIIPDYAKDIRLNYVSLFDEDNHTDLSRQQVIGILYSVFLTVEAHSLADMLLTAYQEQLDEQTQKGIKSAVSIMAMNNIYYRFMHLSSNSAYQKMPARLRMNVIGKPGIDKQDFELYSLAISAITGCGLCVDSHEKTLKKSGLSELGIQNAIRVAAIAHSVVKTVSIGS